MTINFVNNENDANAVVEKTLLDSIFEELGFAYKASSLYLIQGKDNSLNKVKVFYEPYQNIELVKMTVVYNGALSTQLIEQITNSFK